MPITFVTRKFGNVERNSHCDALHITPIRVARLVLDCNGVFAIKAYIGCVAFHGDGFILYVAFKACVYAEVAGY